MNSLPQNVIRMRHSSDAGNHGMRDIVIPLSVENQRWEAEVTVVATRHSSTTALFALAKRNTTGAIHCGLCWYGGAVQSRRYDKATDMVSTDIPHGLEVVPTPPDWPKA
jgi:hypothetical protein